MLIVQNYPHPDNHTIHVRATDTPGFKLFSIMIPFSDRGAYLLLVPQGKALIRDRALIQDRALISVFEKQPNV